MILTSTALITISTRASLKRYHTYTLTLGLTPESTSPPSEDDAAIEGDGYTYSIQRIGTAAEKQSVEKELAELRERLSKVEEWKRRRDEIDKELKMVMTKSGELAPPPYAERETESGVNQPEAEQASLHVRDEAEAEGEGYEL